ncbi:MAG: hypothetical protein ACLP1Y_07180 [Candidatus Acidiferrales bacterium]
MSHLTTFLSKLIGLYYILVSLAMFMHKQATVDMATAITHNPPVLFVVGLVTLATGLAIVLGHNVWSGGVLPIVVTIIGWLTLIKGLLFLYLSPAAVPKFFLGCLHYERLFYVYVAFCLILGIYLTYAGSRSTARQAT